MIVLGQKLNNNIITGPTRPLSNLDIRHILINGWIPHTYVLLIAPVYKAIKLSSAYCTLGSYRHILIIWYDMQAVANKAQQVCVQPHHLYVLLDQQHIIDSTSVLCQPPHPRNTSTAVMDNLRKLWLGLAATMSESYLRPYPTYQTLMISLTKWREQLCARNNRIAAAALSSNDTAYHATLTCAFTEERWWPFRRVIFWVMRHA